MTTATTFDVNMLWDANLILRFLWGSFLGGEDENATSGFALGLQPRASSYPDDTP